MIKKSSGKKQSDPIKNLCAFNLRKLFIAVFCLIIGANLVNIQAQNKLPLKKGSNLSDQKSKSTITSSFGESKKSLKTQNSSSYNNSGVEGNVDKQDSIVTSDRKITNAIQAKLTKSDNLKQLSDSYANKYNKNKEVALKLAKEKGWLIRREVDGKLMELQGIDENNKPLYYITHNAGAAKTTSTDQLYYGSSLGLNLDGSGIFSGVWDGGGVLTSHQEFTNTGTSRIYQKDNPSSTNYHSTHVAGTMVAGGVVANAKGMAFNGELNAYDWDADISEMAANAADGLLISNHSYGYVHGWSADGYDWAWYGDGSISTEEDYNFGFYSTASQNFDEVAYNAPYYLIVKSAGNDRGEGPINGDYPQDGPYDCIGTAATAKNILTVGAIYELSNGYEGNPEDVLMSPFSCWGPVDDGRIKPDIVAKGVNTYSTYNNSNDAYNSISGTSMASPAAAGSLMLLQQHYHNLYNEYMKSATLKALAIHTANECGPDQGPDYMYGWGLLNAKNAANTISKNNVETLIQERSYAGETQIITVKASGTEPLVVTMAWTDLPGTPVDAQLDPADVMLVNDLDIKISANGKDYYPYKLDKDNPAAPATTGINDVDNVEKIVIDSPVVGQEYIITVSHKGTITNGWQDYSMIASGIVMDGVYTVTFNVTDTEGVLEGATVNVGGLQRVTDSEGNVSFVVLDENTYDYSVSMYGYYSQTGSITVGGEDINRSIQLDPLPSYDVTFNITSAQTGEPIEYASIILGDQSVLTNELGEAVVNKVLEGDHSYVITANEYASYEGDITINGADESISIALEESPILWDNFSTANSSTGIISSNYGGLGEIPTGLIESADDFTVPVGAVWNDIDIYAYGFSSDVYPESFYVVIYNDDEGLPGSKVFEDIRIPSDVKNPVFFLNNLGLGSGKYWLSIAGNYPDAKQVSEARWNFQTIINSKDNEAILCDHPNLFNTGTDWSLAADLLSQSTISLKFAVYKAEERFPVAFTLKDQNNEVVVGASIVFEDNRTVKSDENGTAEIYQENGDYTFTIHCKGYDNYTGSLTVNGNTVSKTISLIKQPQYDVHFTVKNEEGNVLSNAKILVTSEGKSLTTDVNGFASTTLLPGTYNYSAIMADYETQKGSFTITNVDVDETIELVYNGVFFFESFEDDISGWTMVDADGDGYNWQVSTSPSIAIDGSNLITSESYSFGPLSPENWIISPEIDLTEKTGVYYLEYYVGAQDKTYPYEHYKCIISTIGGTVSDFTDDNILMEETLEGGFSKRFIDLTSYVGKKIHIAWVHYDCTDQYRINLDAIKVYKNISKDAGLISINSPTNKESCSLTDTEAISATVMNYGGYDITNITMRYSIDGGTPVEEVFDNILIAPGQQQDIVFSEPADFSLLGRYSLNVECEVQEETVLDNNQLETIVDNGDAVITVRALSGAGSADHWTITDENGTVIREHSGYDTNIQEDIDICIQSSNCYTFEFSGFTQADNETPSEKAWIEILYNGETVWGGENPGNAGSPVKVQYIGECSNFELRTVKFAVTFGDEPVTNANVNINGSNYTTNSKGLASIIIPDGEYEYTISANRFVDKKGTIVVNAFDAIIDVELLLRQEIYFESFEGDISDWINIDNDGDGFKWYDQELETGKAIDGDHCFTSKSWDTNSGALTPENWLISPEIDLSNLTSATLSYYIGPDESSYPLEHYKCIVSTTGPDIDNFIDDNIVYEETVDVGDYGLNFNKRTIDLSAYVGQKIRLAWVHYNSEDVYAINLDAISISTVFSSDETIGVDIYFKDVNRNAINNVEVTVNDQTKYTDAEGMVHITRMVEGVSYNYNATVGLGYNPKSGQFVAKENTPVRVKMDVISPANFKIKNSYYQPEIELSWLNDATQRWFQYDNDIISSGIGTNAPGLFDVAIMLDEADLNSYDGYAITQFAFAPFIEEASKNAAFTMHIWNEDEDVIYTQQIESYEPNVINIIELNTPYIIDVSKPIYIGYTVDTPGGYPLGCDAGPATPYKSDLINLGSGFQSVSTDFGIDVNWIIRALASSDYEVVNSVTKSEMMDQNTRKMLNKDNLILSTVLSEPIVLDYPKLKSTSNFSFNIYRDGAVISNSTDTRYAEILKPGVYNYSVTTVFNGAESNASESLKAVYYGTNTTDRKTVLFESVINTSNVVSKGIETGLNDMLKEGYDVSNINYCINDGFENNYSTARAQDYYNEEELVVNIDGIDTFSGGDSESLFNTYQEYYFDRITQKSILDMDLSVERNVDGKCIVTVNIHELFKLYESGYILHLALVENNIAFNWTEATTINSILRKMYPDEKGTPVQFTDGDATISVEVDIDNTVNVNNLELIAFVQHDLSKEVMQAVKSSVPSISGHLVTFDVKDENGNPLGGASITINATTIYTNSNGIATIYLEDGSYNFIVNVNGFEMLSGRFVRVEGVDVIESITLIATGISNSISNVNIYPNPVKDFLNIENIDSDSEILILINNSAGRLIRKEVIPMGINKTQIDLADLAHGVYFVTLISNNQIMNNAKIVK